MTDVSRKIATFLGHHAQKGPWFAALASLGIAFVYALPSVVRTPVLLLGLDDGYIHARLADNLAATGVLGLDPGAGGGGSSSCLWTLLSSGLAVMGIPGELAVGILSLISLPIAVGFASRLLFDLLPPAHAWLGSALVACSGQAIALSLTGMESLLFAAAVVASMRDEVRGRRNGATIWLGVAALVRVEAVLAAIAYALVELASPSGDRSWRLRCTRAATVLVVTFAAAAAGTAILTGLAHGPVTTLDARRWLYGLAPSLVLTGDQLTEHLPVLLGSLWRRLAEFHGPGGPVGRVWAFLAVGVGLVGVEAAARLGRRLLVVPLYLLLQIVFVLFVIGNDGHLSRYLAPVWLLAPVLVALGWSRLASRSETWLRWAATLSAVVLLALYVPQIYRWAEWRERSVAHLREVHLAMAGEVARVVPRGEPVAALDVGVLAYFGDRTPIDLGGLSDREMARALRRNDVGQVLESRGVRYVVLPGFSVAAGDEGWTRRLGLEGKPRSRTSRTSTPIRDARYLQATKVAMPVLSLYELHW
jgi:hypothetical protein